MTPSAETIENLKELAEYISTGQESAALVEKWRSRS